MNTAEFKTRVKRELSTLHEQVDKEPSFVKVNMRSYTDTMNVITSLVKLADNCVLHIEDCPAGYQLDSNNVNLFDVHNALRIVQQLTNDLYGDIGILDELREKITENN